MHVQSLDRLAAEVAAAHLSRPEVEGILYRLTPQQRRLFLWLCDHGPSLTPELRESVEVVNISEVAKQTNLRLEAVGDPRRIVCSRQTPAPGKCLSLGLWRIEGVGNDRRAAT